MGSSTQKSDMICARVVLSALLASVTPLPFVLGVGEDLSCDKCSSLLLTSTGGLSNEWPIFLHTWVEDGSYDALPKYRCDECFGSRKKLIWLHDRKATKYVMAGLVTPCTCA